MLSISAEMLKIAARISKKDLEEKVILMLQKNPNPSDFVVHAWSEKNGYDTHKVEAMIYSLATKYVKSMGTKSKAAADSKAKGFVTNIEKDTKQNKNFRKVLYTGKHSQLVLMTLKAGEEIGEEVHTTIDQFFRIDEGGGKVMINGSSHKVKDGSAFIVPAGAKHNVIAGDEGMKLYSVYSPPNHKDGTIHKTKEDAEANEEHFDGKATE